MDTLRAFYLDSTGLIIAVPFFIAAVYYTANLRGEDGVVVVDQLQRATLCWIGGGLYTVIDFLALIDRGVFVRLFISLVVGFFLAPVVYSFIKWVQCKFKVNYSKYLLGWSPWQYRRRP